MINTVVLMGRLTAEPELKTTNSGISVATFQIAVDRRFDKEKNADFIHIVAWRQTAEFVKNYFGKGDMIALQGSLQSRNYEDKNGNKRTAYEVIADQVSFCGWKKETARDPANGQIPADPLQISMDDDLPF